MIELIVVITILAILAAVALPRFVGLQVEARIAKINGALGAMKAGAALARSVQLTQGLAPNASVVMEGATVTMANGYPTVASIALAAGISSEDFPATAPSTVSGLQQISVQADLNHPNCAVIYREAGVNGAPVYGIPLDPSNATDRANCS
jgi:MSHA pilin protein MshA